MYQPWQIPQNFTNIFVKENKTLASINTFGVKSIK